MQGTVAALESGDALSPQELAGGTGGYALYASPVTGTPVLTKGGEASHGGARHPQGGEASQGGVDGLTGGEWQAPRPVPRAPCGSH